MRRAAALGCAALALCGCAAGTTNGFGADAPGGWEDRTDVAETRTGVDFEVVFEGAAVDGVPSTLTVARVEGRTPARGAAERARRAVDREFPQANPTAPVALRLDEEPAVRFDYTAGDKRSRYVTARHGDHIYSVTVQASPAGFRRATEVLDGYLRSWRWER